MPGRVQWRGLALLAIASGVFALLAIPTAAVKAPDPSETLREAGIEVQRTTKTQVHRGPSEPPLEPTPQGTCGPGSRPETGLQGRVSNDDHASGRAAEGFTCNTELIGSYTKPNTPLNTVPGYENAFGSVGGFRVHRYVDEAGNECAYYDTTLLFPTNIFDALAGVNVLDMSDPSNPVLSARLLTPAMLSPHESLNISTQRGLLAAVTGNPANNPGVLDIYDISEDCRQPEWLSSTPTGVLGHESGMAPDGRTFYSGSATSILVAIDISNPALPVPLAGLDIPSHGLTLSGDGDRAYAAATVGGDAGMQILDTSEIQARQPFPEFHQISHLQWTSMSIPQNAIPVTIDGDPYVVEIDEFGTLDEVGAARIIDISDETAPEVVSNLRLEVHQPENFAEISGDRGANNSLGGYSGHYCDVPRTTDPGIVACSMPLSGLRVFDIRDPENPREVAYFNAPVTPRTVGGGGPVPDASNWAMSQPAFARKRGEIWYSDGYSGFYAVRVTNGAWVGAGDGGEGNGGGGGAAGGGDDAGGGNGAEGGAAAAGGGDTADATPQAGSDGSASAAGGGGDLPFTGLMLGALALIAVAVLASGLAVRWSERQRYRAPRSAQPRRARQTRR